MGGKKSFRDHKLFHIVVKIFGYILLIIGLIGLIMPILPGWALIIVGLMILGEESLVGRNVIHRLPEKFQKRFKKKGQGSAESRKTAEGQPDGKERTGSEEHKGEGQTKSPR